MEFMIRVEIPALDRLCDLMESRTPWLSKSKEALQSKLQEAVQQVAAQTSPKPQTETVARAAEQSGQELTPAMEAVQAAQETPETPKSEPETKPTANLEPPKGTAVTLDAVQRASAELRDQGKLKAVTDMFPKFGIKKLSDLSGDKLQAFAERLRKMGATL